ncbi:odorant receptor 94b [Drosophila guanche]|uniref:Odorant receptor n=1 Tax=Drosophila guanche TaxID=7266 RepID=A0A3B0JRM6_DROGU|nr:odorant receptor 94b [Drosophila guanche]SPP83022.1 blast:Odorant receptor 94b [Drosophila guanche]
MESTDRIAAVRFLITLQRWTGLFKWQDENGTDLWSKLKRIHPFVLHLPLTFTYIALMWLEALTSADFEQAGQVLYMSLTELALVTKIINFWYRREQVSEFIRELSEDPAYELRTREEVELWHRQQRHFKRIFYFYIRGSLFVAAMGYFSVFVQEEYELPFGYYVPFEWRTPERYYYAWGYNVIAMTLCCLSNIVLDTMGCYFMFHIAMLYRVVNLRLRALHQAPEKVAAPELRAIFRLHTRVRRLTRQCEVLVSPYVLSQVVFSAFIICFSAYRLMHMGFRERPGLFLTTLQFVAAMTVQIFLPCYYGNELTFHASALTNSVFHTNWLEYSVPTRKMLNCYMEFLKRPVKVRAGVFFEIGLPIFVKTINNAYSFFALLLKVSK